ncbi:EamA family transporter [Neorhizobium galegae]|uniref:DMT family transporter n=1 Tax=Neorhizobium galegae TaxID=399 RepID=UPI00062211E5|nr:EamA family transporter [Neorhizobium galegae]MCQ1775708.1 EamA family transporter [Neorhizobium galegae]MCQ1799954.1 EamA family transporter [Neorhizobium galegae]CDZ30716.1 Putative DMT superfamily transporter inner membrane protein [Neorhizobium galegae bv. officinalis]
MSSTGNITKFLILCLVWGLTWIAVKVGVTSTPPMLFAATRFIFAGLVLLGWGAARGVLTLPCVRHIGRLLVTSLLMITLCYGPLFWGMKFVPSGTAAVLEMSLTPLALLAFGIALGEERWSGIRLGAMMLGVTGLIILFGPAAATPDAGLWTIFGLVAVAWAAISSAWGSVLARPLVSGYGSTTLSASTTLIGGILLLSVSLTIETDATAALVTLWNWQASAGWLFLVIFGSLIGYSIYLQLLRDIGPARAGSFAFVSPAIAVAVGAILAGETVTFQSITGMILMMLAAGGCLFADRIGAVVLMRKKA